MLENRAADLAQVAQGRNLLAILVGALPGRSGGMGIALRLSFTFMFPAPSALALLTPVYGAAEYGGSIAAAPIDAPGEGRAVPHRRRWLSADAEGGARVRRATRWTWTVEG